MVNKTSFKVVLCFIMTFVISCMTVRGVSADADGGYNRSNAASYAQKYALSHNTSYPYFNGTDCANFVSQCLVAGGYSQKSDFKPYLFFNLITCKNWTVAQDLYNYLIYNKCAKEISVVKLKDLKGMALNYCNGLCLGDVLFFDWDNTSGRVAEHAVICSKVITTSTCPNHYISAHSNAKKDVQWCLKDIIVSSGVYNMERVSIHVLRIKWTN